MELSSRRIYFFGALGGLLFGYDTGVISGAILFIPDDFKLTPFLQGADRRVRCCSARWSERRSPAGCRTASAADSSSSRRA